MVESQKDITNAMNKLSIHPKIENYPMYVCNPVIKDGMKKYVVYSLKGSAIHDDEVRRFSDFFSLRKKLVERWPGIFIPAIPPKKAVGNLDDNTIETRMRLLNSFCYKLSKSSFLFESEEVKLFQSNTLEVAKAIDKLMAHNDGEILEKYKVAFPDYYDAYDLILGKGKLKEFQNFLKKTLTNIKNFKEVVSNTLSKKKEEIENYSALIKSFEEHEKADLMEYTESDETKLVFSYSGNTEIKEKVEKLKEQLNNPYVDLFEWLEEEDIEIEAMLEAMSGFDNMVLTYDKLTQKSDSLEQDIKNLQLGQGGGFTSLFKNKDKVLAELQASKKKTEEDIQNLHNIIKLTAFNMESHLESFKTDKLNEYYRHLKIFATLQKQNDQVLNELWETVGKDRNIVETIQLADK